MSDYEWEDFEEYEDLNSGKRTKADKNTIRQAVKEFRKISTHWSNAVYKSCEVNTPMPTFEDVLEEIRLETENLYLDKMAKSTKTVVRTAPVISRAEISKITPAISKIISEITPLSPDSINHRSYKEALTSSKPVLVKFLAQPKIANLSRKTVENQGQNSDKLMTCRSTTDGKGQNSESDTSVDSYDSDGLSFGDEGKKNCTRDRLMGKIVVRGHDPKDDEMESDGNIGIPLKSRPVTLDEPSPAQKLAENSQATMSLPTNTNVDSALETANELAHSLLPTEQPVISKGPWMDRPLQQKTTKKHKRGRSLAKQTLRMKQHMEQRITKKPTQGVSKIQFPTALQDLEEIPVTKAGEMRAQLDAHIKKMEAAEAEMSRATAAACRAEMIQIRSKLASVEPTAPELQSNICPTLVWSEVANQPEPTNAELRAGAVKQIMHYRQPRAQMPAPPNYPPPPLQRRSPSPTRRSRSPPRRRDDHYRGDNNGYQRRFNPPTYYKRNDNYERHSMTRRDLGDIQPMGASPTLHPDATKEQKEVLRQARAQNMPELQRNRLIRSMNDIVQLSQCNAKRLKLCNRSDWQSPGGPPKMHEVLLSRALILSDRASSATDFVLSESVVLSEEQGNNVSLLLDASSRMNDMTEASIETVTVDSVLILDSTLYEVTNLVIKMLQDELHSAHCLQEGTVTLDTVPNSDDVPNLLDSGDEQTDDEGPVTESCSKTTSSNVENTTTVKTMWQKRNWRRQHREKAKIGRAHV